MNFFAVVGTGIMSTPAAFSDELFRYAIVRSPSRLRIRVAPDPISFDDGNGSPALLAVAESEVSRGATKSDLRRLGEEYVNDQKGIFNKEVNTKFDRFLSRTSIEDVGDYNSERKLIEKVEEKIGAIEEFVTSDEFETIKSQAWNSLIANALVGNTKHFGGKLNRVINRVSFLEHLAKKQSRFKKPEDVKLFSTLRPSVQLSSIVPRAPRVDTAEQKEQLGVKYALGEKIRAQISELSQLVQAKERLSDLSIRPIITEKDSKGLAPELAVSCQEGRDDSSTKGENNKRSDAPKNVSVCRRTTKCEPELEKEACDLLNELRCSGKSWALRQLDVASVKDVAVAIDLVEREIQSRRSLLQKLVKNRTLAIGSLARQSENEPVSEEETLQQNLLFENILGTPSATGGMNAVEAAYMFSIGDEMPRLLYTLAELEALAPSITSVNVGDLFLVKQKLLRYEAAEISHIENVLMGELRERAHERTVESEVEITREETEEEELERDLQTTSRFEMEEQVQETLSSQVEGTYGVSISAGYGPVSIDSSTNFGSSRSRESNYQSARSFSQETTEKTVEKVKSKITLKRRQLFKRKMSERNLHSFAASDQSVSGIYRWIDKVYENRLMNYGIRLFVNFWIPEPSSFLRQVRGEVVSRDNESLRPPAALGDLKPENLNVYNYQDYVERYKVEDATPPPPLFVHVSTNLSYTRSGGDGTDYVVQETSDLKVPDGYVSWAASTLSLTITRSGYANPRFMGSVGDANFGNGDDYVEVYGITDVVPVSVATTGHLAFSTTVDLSCRRTDQHHEQWQIDTYKKIVAAYKEQLLAYEEKLQQAQFATVDGSFASVRSSQKMETIHTELKKGCVYMMGAPIAVDLDWIEETVAPSGYAFPNRTVVTENSKYIEFFESAFEWSNLTYELFPYFWAESSSWDELVEADDSDSMFARFLRSGSARVTVPVDPKFVETVLYFLSTGVIWEGDALPSISDDYYNDLLEEIEAAPPSPEKPEQVGDPWISKVPTELIILQNTLDEGLSLPNFET